MIKMAHSHCDDDTCEDVEPEFRPPARIFYSASSEATVPPGYDAVSIALDGRMTSDLCWKEQRAAAEKYISMGLRIFWDLDLGLFSNLNEPLDSNKQFLALSLSLEHFRDTLWQAFHDHTAGLCLYRGPCDYSLSFCWNHSQLLNLQEWLKDLFSTIGDFNRETRLSLSSFSIITPSTLQHHLTTQRLLSFFCAQSCCEFLELLALRLPDMIPLFVHLDTSAASDGFTRAQLLSPELYARFHLLSPPEFLSHTAICLPPISQCRPSVTEPLIPFFSSAEPVRAIPEALLTLQWHELDTLIIAPNPSSSLQRKLNGFRAAGGTVIEAQSV